jgi:hypothetical protein
MIRRTVACLSALPLALALSAPAAGADVRFFQLHTRDAFLGGTLDGLSVDPLGTLRLADRASRLAAIGEPFLFSTASHPDGWVLGTGNDGRVMLVERSGEVSTLFSAPEPEVFAVWADEDGTVFAGTSPQGKVYRITAGEAEPFFDPGETYIWALGRAAGGDLLVATGTEGRLWQVDAQGKGEVIFDSEDTHLRSIKLLEDGDLLAGTAGEGLILRIDPEGRARTLYDGAQPEVVALASGGDGWCYAALLASEASFTDLQRQRQKAAKEGEQVAGEEEEAAGTVTVVAEAEPPPAAGSRPGDFTGARSELVRISPSGRVESIWKFDDETVYSLLWHRDRLWVATGLEGKLFSFRDGAMVLEKDVDERQVVSLEVDDPGPAFATTNAAALYRLSAESERKGTFTSPALDAGQIARFGSMRWRGRMPRGAGMRFSARSGMSASPDTTWSDWTAPGGGREVPLTDLAAGRYLQWKVELEAAGSVSPELSEVTVSYRQANLPPTIKSLTVLGPGEILVPASFNPANQVFEPIHPNREGIFTTLDTGAPRADQRLKTLWKRGFRSLRWEAEDPNEDELIYDLAFRAEDAPDAWLPVGDELEKDHYGFDATALPDGVYRFRLRAADRGENSLEEPMVATEISEPVLIDHTPPALEKVERRGGTLRLEVADHWNPLSLAELSADGGPWRPLNAADGLLDGEREVLLVDQPPDARLLLLRVMDAAFNTVTFDLTGEER